MDLFLLINSSPNFVLHLCVKKRFKKLGLIGPFLDIHIWIICNFFNVELKRSALKSRLRKYITCWGFRRAFGRKLSIYYSKYIQYFQICGFEVYMDNFLPNSQSKPQHVIYFRNLLVSANMFFNMPKVYIQKWSDRP